VVFLIHFSQRPVSPQEVTASFPIITHCPEIRRSIIRATDSVVKQTKCYGCVETDRVALSRAGTLKSCQLPEKQAFVC
jgi:hypothetical protein